MRSSTVTFFAVEADLQLLMKQFELQSLVVLPVSHRVDEPPKPQPAIDYAVDETAVLLMPREFSLSDIPYIEGNKGQAGIARADLEVAPVIIFTPAVLWGTKLDAGMIEMQEESSD